MLSDVYRWYEPYGFGPDADSLDWIRRELGGDSPVDAGLRGGETMRLGPDRRIEILHLPGHTLGHLGFWRSEEHTSELQSRQYLVCPLLLEKKKNISTAYF